MQVVARNCRFRSHTLPLAVVDLVAVVLAALAGKTHRQKKAMSQVHSTPVLPGLRLFRLHDLLPVRPVTQRL